MRRVLMPGLVAAVLLGGCAQAKPPAATPMADQPTIATPAEQTGSATPQASVDTPEATATPSETPTETPSATPSASKPIFTRGATDPKVRELQARLRSLGLFSDYDVTSIYGPATQKAVREFQRIQKLPVTGTVDETTWARLQEKTKQPSSDELNNMVPGEPVIEKKESLVRSLQARLAQLGLFKGTVDGKTFPTEGVTAFQKSKKLPVTGKVDQRTWDRLRSSTRQPTEGELGGVTKTVPPASAAALPEECTKWGRAICVDMSERKLRWVVDGKIVMQMDARFGNSEAGYPTKLGTFRVLMMYKDYKSKAFGSEMPYSMFYDNEGRAVHYSANFARVGYRGTSHGCVNVRDKGKIAALFNEVRHGDRVVITR